jgi:hypothetical protein
VAAAGAAAAITLVSLSGVGRPSHGQQPIGSSGPPVTGRPTPSSLPTASNGPPVAVTAPYAVMLNTRAGRPPVAVIDMRTGKTLARVRLPAGHAVVWWAAAAGDDRTFVLAVTTNPLGVQVTRFYLLHLASDGQPGPLTPLPVPPLRDDQIYGMAVTADASKLAIVWQYRPSGGPPSHIEVASLATGVTRTWTSAQGAAQNLSWAGDHTLAFDWQDSSLARSGIRLLDTSKPGSSPLASRLLIPASFRFEGLRNPDSPLISQDGSAVIAFMTIGNQFVLVKFSTRTGKVVAGLSPSVGSTGSASFCGVLWADRTGQHLFFQCGNTQGSVNGTQFSRLKLPRIRQSVVGFADTFAW